MVTNEIILLNMRQEKLEEEKGEIPRPLFYCLSSLLRAFQDRQRSLMEFNLALETFQGHLQQSFESIPPCTQSFLEALLEGMKEGEEGKAIDHAVLSLSEVLRLT